ncbi:MAG TPA: SAM-dependent methyltransferase [Solirubrobacteraceae bacterium]|nr:SAM-dependent methyltransferase [Solirubrobacteraceae bacterium]
MSLADFEARYRADPDPWGYRSSEYEKAKYAATLQACGPGPFASALELGASIGVFSGQLAPRCRCLITIDAAPTAVSTAREHLAALEGAEHTDVRLGTIPADLPDGRFELVVASEILYYLDAGELQATLDALRERLVPGARLVAVHWRPDGAERPLTAAAVHAALRALPWLSLAGSSDTDAFRLDAFTRA